MSKPDLLHIQIGHFQADYHLGTTSAPKAFDGFGTIHLTGDETPAKDEPRLVAIRDEHFTWQTTRYRSGLYQFEADDGDLTRWVVDQLYKRLMAGAE